MCLALPHLLRPAQKAVAALGAKPLGLPVMEVQPVLMLWAAAPRMGQLQVCWAKMDHLRGPEARKLLATSRARSISPAFTNCPKSANTFDFHALLCAMAAAVTSPAGNIPADAVTPA